MVQMTIRGWLTAAQADAARRGMPEIQPLLESLAKAMQALRSADFNDEAGGRHAPVTRPHD